jgi:hypothetical protein
MEVVAVALPETDVNENKRRERNNESKGNK